MVILNYDDLRVYCDDLQEQLKEKDNEYEELTNTMIGIKEMLQTQLEEKEDIIRQLRDDKRNQTITIDMLRDEIKEAYSKGYEACEKDYDVKHRFM